jgi:branched-chain amino acid transport system substrate-binding protein
LFTKIQPFRRVGVAAICALTVTVFATSCASSTDSSTSSASSASTAASASTEAKSSSTAAATSSSTTATTAPAGATVAAKPATTCGKPAAGKPIKLGHINITGTGLDIPGAAFALEVYFDKLNACGGYKGQPLELVIRNGGLDPAATGAAARELVEQQGVIGFVGSNAFLDCLVNGEYYLSKAVPVIASSFDGTCFTNKVIFPHLANFDRNIFPGIVNALEKGAKKFAYLAVDIPGQRSQSEAIDAYLKANGASLETSIFLPPGPADPTNAVLQIQQSGATAVIASIDELALGAALNAANQQGIGPKKTLWIGPSGLYSPKAVAALGPAGDGVLVVANYDLSENGSALAAQIAKDVKAKHPEAQIDGFAQLGWIAGEMLEAAMGGVDGELTSASLLAAMDKLGPFQSKLLPGPLTVNGPLPRQLVSYALIAKLEGGVFKLDRPDWMTFPKK